jgi:2-polyprenyl-3-methyl-5-hydroxy-6-metoxy-1,4-benzoquinol methylase
MSIEVSNLSAVDRQTIAALLEMIGTASPTLEQLWGGIDLIWDRLGCDNRKIDPEKLSKFYSHPIWLLNGLFVEQHPPSLKHREGFARWVSSKNPKRVADFGGGYGTLARLIAFACPSAEIHVIEPHPHTAALQKSAFCLNLAFKSNFIGEYDVIIATDVFEHVPDPIAVVENSSRHLKRAGYYVMANNFYPVIKCHLPDLFHFRHTWDYAMASMNLKRMETVVYGAAYLKKGQVNSNTARWVEAMSKLAFPSIQRLKALRFTLGARRRAFQAYVAHRRPS